MLTAITEINRSGAKSARGLVSIQSRYNQILDETSSTGQKLIDFYNENNIQLYDQDGQLRSLWETLSDVASIWDTLSENQQKYFLNIQAGANQSVQLGALMSNFQTAIDATNTALNSSGSAMKENEAYMESLAARTNLLKADFQTLANDIISKDLVGSFLDLGSALLQFADTGLGQVITKVGLLTGIGWGASSLLQASKVIPVVTGQVTAFASTLGSLSTLTFRDLSAAMQLASEAGLSLSETLTMAGTSVASLSSMALPIIAGISLGVVGISALVKKIKEMQEALDPINQMLSSLEQLETIRENQQHAQTVLELTQRYNELAYAIRMQQMVGEADAETMSELQSVISQLSTATEGAISANAEYNDSLTQTVNAIQQNVIEEQRRVDRDTYSWLLQNSERYKQALDTEAQLTQELTDLEAQRSDQSSYYKASTEQLEELLVSLRQKAQEAYSGSAEDIRALREEYERLTGKTLAGGANIFDEIEALSAIDLDPAGEGLGVIDERINAIREDLGTTTDFINNYKESADELFEMVRRGSITDAEAMSFLGLSFESYATQLEDYLYRVEHGESTAQGAVDAFNAEIYEQTQALLTLEDELGRCAQKIQDFQNATSTEKGDTLKQYASAYGQFLEAWQQGLVGSNAVSAGLDLFLGEGWQERLQTDLQGAGDFLASEFFQTIFAAGGEDYGANLMGILAEDATDLGNGLKELSDEGLGTIAVFEETADGLEVMSVNYDKLAQYLGVDKDMLMAFAEALEIFGGKTVETSDEALALADTLGAVTDLGDGLSQIDITKLAQGLVEAGNSQEDVEAIFDLLSNIDGVSFDQSLEGLSSLISNLIDAKEKADEAKQGLEETDAQETDPEVTLNTTAFDTSLADVKRRLQELANTEYAVTVRANMAAEAEGTNFAEGGDTLVNEEGPELIQFGGKAWIAGGGLPTVTNLPKGARVFTAEETQRILGGRSFNNAIPAHVGGTNATANGNVNTLSTGRGTTGMGIVIPNSFLAGRNGTGNAQTSVVTTVSTNASNVNTSNVTATGDKSYKDILDAHNATLTLLKAQYDLLEAQNASADDIVDKAKEIQAEYEATITDLKNSPEYLADDVEALTEVVNLTKDWYDWQDKIVEDLKDVAEVYETHINLIDSEIDLLEKQEDTEYKRINLLKEAQDNLHTEAEVLRAIVANADALGMSAQEVEELQTEINKLSKQWWDYQEKISDVYDEIIEKNQKLIDMQLDNLNNQVDGIKALQDAMGDYYDRQIADIDAQIEALQSANEELEEQVALEEKLDAIATARQKKVMVYKDGRWQYISDADAVSSAVKDYNDYVKEKQFNDTIAGLEAQKDALNDLKDQWNNLDAEYTKIQRDLLIKQALGIDTSLENWENFVGEASEWANKYLQLMMSISQMENAVITAEPTGASGNAPSTGKAPIVGYNSGYDKNVDYSDLIANASSWDEAQHWAALRNMKIAGEGITGGVDTATLLKQWTASHYASGTLSAAGGLSLVGEGGAELRVLGKGDGIIPANMTKNLMAWGQFTPTQYAQQTANIGGQSMNVTIQALNLPNVSDGAGFVDYVKNNMFGQVLSLVH